MKKIWQSVLHAVTYRMRYTYEGNTLRGSEYVVRVTVTVSEGREESRMVALELTTREADDLIERLRTAKEWAKEANSSLDLIEHLSTAKEWAEEANSSI